MSIKFKSNSRLSPEYVLLGFLYLSPSHGYKLHQQLHDQFSNIWHASQSQTYNILKRLETQGYIHSTSVEQDRFPTRQLLEITPSGVERFEAWLSQPSKVSVHSIRVEFITRLYFTQQYHPGRLQKMIQAQLEAVEAGVIQLKRLMTKLSDDDVFNRLALELRLELLGSVISWLERCYQASMPGGGDGHGAE